LDPQKTSLSDQDLLKAFRLAGDSNKFGLLLEKYTLMVFGVCMKYLKNTEDAQDMTQMVFEKAFLEAGKYEIPYFKSWIYAVARNMCLMKLRSANPLQASSTEITDYPDEENFSEEDLNDREYWQETKEMELYKALNQLSTDQSNCIRLFYLEKRSYQEIQHMLGLNFQQVKSHIQNGKRMLKMMLAKKILTHE
jgi:RNA polymerase sigma-70 factor (ECF subfamily)